MQTEKNNHISFYKKKKKINNLKWFLAINRIITRDKIFKPMWSCGIYVQVISVGFHLWNGDNALAIKKM